MKINQLIYFAMAAKYNNISKASKKLYVSQPAVSLAIKDLEEEFNKRYKDSSIFDVPELDVIYDAEPYVGYLLDILCTGTEEEKKELFIKGRKEVDDIVSRINNIRAGCIVIKIPTKRTATSLIAPHVKWFAFLTDSLVVLKERNAAAKMMTISINAG